MVLGVAFSGGGVRSASQLGIMQALYQAGLRPAVFAGTSGGSVVATLLAMGLTPKEAFEHYKKTTNVTDIAFAHILAGIFSKGKINGFVKGAKLEKQLQQSFMEGVFADIMYNRLGIVTTDIQTGEQIIFVSGPYDAGLIQDDNAVVRCEVGKPLVDVVSASCRMPMIFIPKHIDGRKLVDGGITNNLPSDVVRALGADKVISIDLGYAGKTSEVNGVYSILKQSFEIMMERNVDANKGNYGVYLNPKIYDVKVLETNRIQECYERGYKYALDNLEEILKQLED